MIRRLLSRQHLPILSLLLAAFAAKVAAGPARGPFGLDASYYFQLARHVAAGDGLLTSVSLYFEGWHLPARSLAYPLWPLLLGYSARIAGLSLAASVLPRLLYLIDLLLLYLLCRRVMPSFDGGPSSEARRWLPMAALIAALFASNPTFFSATTHPYTEGLAFAFTFGALLALRPDPSVSSAAGSGVLSALAFLARTQMICVALGILLALIVDVCRKRSVRSFVAFAVAASLPVAFWFWITGFVPLLGWIRPGRRLPQADLPRFPQWFDAGGPLATLADRLGGIVVAFDPLGACSYFRTFGAVAVLPPAALLFWMSRRLFTTHPDGRKLPADALATLAAGLFFFATLLWFHSRFFLPWFFGWRHGLPFILLLIPAAAYLASSSPALRIVVMFTALLSLMTGAAAVGELVRAGTAQPLMSGERSFAAWAATQPQSLTFMTTHAQTLGFLTRQQYHWTDCAVSPSQTRLMMERLPIDFVVVYETETGCSYLKGLGRELRPGLEFGTPGQRLFLLRPAEHRAGVAG